jgi:hypothetical protein
MLGRRKKAAAESEPSQAAEPQRGQNQGGPPADDGLPGSAGYPIGKLAKRGKNAMPPQRFRFVRPDGKPD